MEGAFIKSAEQTSLVIADFGLQVNDTIDIGIPVPALS